MSDTPTGSDTPSVVAAPFQPAHTRTISSSHTRTLSSTHNVPGVHASVLAAHTQQLTSIPPELPQLTVTTPTTIYSAYTTQSTPSSFGTNGGSPPFSPPVHVPDAPVPAIPEQYRQVQPSIGEAAAPKSPHTMTLPAVIITNPTPPAHQARFASPMTANPKAPVLPRLATPGSAVTPANIARKPIPAIITSPPTDAELARVKANGGAKSYSPPPRASPGSGGKHWSPPTKPYAPGSISTMSPVAAARSFNNRRSIQQPHPFSAHHAKRGSDETIDSPTVATTNLYAASRGRDKADRSLADRVVGRETLFDLDVDEEKGTADARELPLDDLLGNELPEYIQVYLTPHPDRDGVGAKDAFGDYKAEKEKLGALDEKAELSEKELSEKEAEYRANKWNDIEASLPAYKSTASLQRPPGYGRESPVPSKKSSKRHRYIPTKTSTRVICMLVLFFVFLVVPLVTFGVVHSMQGKAKNNDAVATTSESSASAPDAPMITPLVEDPDKASPDAQVPIASGDGN